ncbi:MAG: PepSY-associated TM helix domain-containing protein [Bacteroidota bacterium]
MMEEHQSDKRVYNAFFNTHTVAGIIISIGIFVIFLAGAFALFQKNINNWEVNSQNNEIQLTEVDYDRILAEVAKKGYQMYGRDFRIQVQENRGTYLAISAGAPSNKISKDSLSRLTPSDSLAYVEATARINYAVDTKSYELTPPAEYGKAGRIGWILTQLHYFRQIPVVGIYLAGFLSLLLLFALVSGVVIHWKKMVSNFFTFRLKSSIKNLWTDGHTALGILGLPYQFMYAVTGAIFGLSILVLPVAYLVFGDVNKATAIILPENKSYELKGEADLALSINPFVQAFFNELPDEDIKNFNLTVKSYGDKNAHLDIASNINTKLNFAGYARSVFRLDDGEPVYQKPLDESSFRTSSLSFFVGLHFGNFGGLMIQITYFIMAILTSFVIITGVMIWLVAREKKTYAHKTKFNRNVGAIYLGACLGLYPAIALLFVTAKIVPLDLDGRYTIINSVFFGFWLAYSIYAFLNKRSYEINKYALIIAGVFGLFIPVTNGIQTGLWFWKSLGMGYADSFLVDVAWLIMSVITLIAAWKAKPVDKKRKVIDEVEVEALENVSEKVLVGKQPVFNLNSTSSK